MPTLDDALASGDPQRILRTHTTGNPIADDTDATADALSTIRGTLQIGSQYHYTMEPQTTMCVPAEDGGIDVYTATQWMDLTQIAVAEMLRMPQNIINMSVRRVGGAYGGKISRSTQVACACALACHLTQRPVRFVMTIEANMAVCGKRFACKSDYTILADTLSGQIKSMTNNYVQDAGCSINELQLSITTEAFKGCYGPTASWLVQATALRTDATSHTWCRAPNHTEGIAMIENIMEHIAHAVNKDTSEVRLANMLNDNPMKKIYVDYLKDVGECMGNGDRGFLWFD